MIGDSNTEALLQLARQDVALEQWDAAQAKCMQVLSKHDRHPGALSLLGTVLYSQERHEEAVRIFNALTLMEPAVAEHWRNLGTALRPTKRYDQAIAAFDRALRLAPPTAALLYNLGVLQMERCEYNAAYLALRDAVRLAPRDATIRWGFAQCCYDLVNVEEATEALQNWQSLDGLSIELRVRIVFLLVMMGELASGLPAIEQLLARPPRKGRAALGLATILERLHRLDEARAILEQVALHDPSLDRDPDRLLISAILADRAGEHSAARRDLDLALDNHHEFMHRHHLLYRLAKVLDSLGLYEEAYSAGEEAHRSQLAFIEAAMGKSATSESRIMARAARSCDPNDVATWGSIGPGVQHSPIFVVGFPRSGTTLLEQVLDAHPELKSMDEQPFLLRAHEDILNRGIDYPVGLGALGTQDLDELRARYWERVLTKVTLRPGQRLVDKNPLNMLVLPLMRRLFPQARIILLIRHPCDVLLSCFMQNFRAPELALLCRDLPTLARTYAQTFGYWYSQWPLLQPQSYELRYERLITDFVPQVRELADFLQLPWNEAMLAPAERARAKGFVSTPSYAQVLEPINSRSVGRWRHYERRFEDVLSNLKPWLERWGYALN
jgi:tetratricopeptide (TPR) repeat protein